MAGTASKELANMRNPQEHWHSGMRSQELLIFLDNGQTHPQIEQVTMVPFVGDGDEPCIGFHPYFLNAESTRIASVRLMGGRLEWSMDAGAMVSHVANRVVNCISVEQFITGLAASFGSLISYRYDESDDEETIPVDLSGWFGQAIAHAVPRSGVDELNSDVYTAVTLRNIASACGAKPTSIKKEDVAKAIVEWAAANPLPTRMPECEPDEADAKNPLSDKTMVASVVDAACAVKQLYFDSHKDLDNWPKFDPLNKDLGFCAFLTPTFVLGGDSAKYIMEGVVGKFHNDVAVMVSMGLPQAESAQSMESYYNQKTRATERWAMAALKKAEATVKENNAMLKAAGEVVDSLRLVREPSHTISEGDVEVEVCGRKFQFYGSPDAPLGIPNYCHDYWSASQRLGTGGAKVTFDAADLFDVVLNEIVTGMVGPPAVGKTSIARHMGHTLGLPVHIVQFTKDKPIEQLIGVDKIREGQQVFEDGEITVAMRAAANDPNTIHIIVFDEFDHAPSEVQSEFHGVVEGRNYVLPSGEVLINHGNMRFVLTRNTTGHGDTTGRHASANVSDSAFNSRIGSTFNVDYMEHMHESALMVIHGLETAEARMLVDFAVKTRDSVASVDSGESFEGMTEPVCLRHMLSYCNARSRGVPINKALALCVVGQLPPRDREVANELAINAMGID